MEFYCVKFENLEKQEEFCNCCEYLGWGFSLLNGSCGGWCVETNGGADDANMIDYLHSLGAFKFENEEE